MSNLQHKQQHLWLTACEIRDALFAQCTNREHICSFTKMCGLAISASEKHSSLTSKESRVMSPEQRNGVQLWLFSIVCGRQVLFKAVNHTAVSFPSHRLCVWPQLVSIVLQERLLKPTIFSILLKESYFCICSRRTRKKRSAQVNISACDKLTGGGRWKPIGNKACEYQQCYG